MNNTYTSYNLGAANTPGAAASASSVNYTKKNTPGLFDSIVNFFKGSDAASNAAATNLIPAAAVAATGGARKKKNTRRRYRTRKLARKNSRSQRKRR
jgi:hypothetical protein